MAMFYEWKLTAIRPNTVSSLRKKIGPLVEAALKEGGHGELLKTGKIKVEAKENFPLPDHDTMMLLAHFATKVGYDIFRTWVLPKLKKIAEVKERPKEKSEVKAPAPTKEKPQPKETKAAAEKKPSPARKKAPPKKKKAG